MMGMRLESSPAACDGGGFRRYGSKFLPPRSGGGGPPTGGGGGKPTHRAWGRPLHHASHGPPPPSRCDGGGLEPQELLRIAADDFRDGSFVEARRHHVADWVGVHHIEGIIR